MDPAAKLDETNVGMPYGFLDGKRWNKRNWKENWKENYIFNRIYSA